MQGHLEEPLAAMTAAAAAAARREAARSQEDRQEGAGGQEAACLAEADQERSAAVLEVRHQSRHPYPSQGAAGSELEDAPSR